MALASPRALFLFNYFSFFPSSPPPPSPHDPREVARCWKERTVALEPDSPVEHPATACYWCKIIFHFQTWGIGFNLCPVSRLAEWKLALVMQINTELQKADKQEHARTERGTLAAPNTAATRLTVFHSSWASQSVVSDNNLSASSKTWSSTNNFYAKCSSAMSRSARYKV